MRLQDRELAIEMVDDCFAGLWNGEWPMYSRPTQFKQLVQQMERLCLSKHPAT